MNKDKNEYESPVVLHPGESKIDESEVIGVIEDNSNPSPEQNILKYSL